MQGRSWDGVLADRPADVGDLPAPQADLEALVAELHQARERKRELEAQLKRANEELARVSELLRSRLEELGLTRATVERDGRRLTVSLSERVVARLDTPPEATDEERAAVLAQAVEALRAMGMGEYVRTTLDFSGLAKRIKDALKAGQELEIPGVRAVRLRTVRLTVTSVGEQ